MHFLRVSRTALAVQRNFGSLDINTCTPAEVSFACLHRLIANFNLGDPVFTNATALHKVRRKFDVAFIKTPPLLPFNVMLPSDFAEASDRDPITQTSYDVHRSIYDSREDVRCIIHSYSEAITHVSCFATEITLDITRFAPNVAIADSSSIPPNAAQEVDKDTSTELYSTAVSRALSQTVKGAAGEVLPSAVFIPHHGAVIVGRSVQVAFLNLYFLDRYCRTASMMSRMRDTVPIEKPMVEYEEDQWTVAAMNERWPRWIESVGLDCKWRPAE